MTTTISSLSTTTSPTGAPGGVATPGGAKPTGSVNDLFAQLKEFSWKGVSFPVTETDLEVRQDLVIHKYADRNGAYVEGTGRHPVQITASIPFVNYIYSAASETWPQGNLYPYQWRNFLKACLEGTSGSLQHPELGLLTCKVDLARTSWRGTVRGGVLVQATWIESDDTQLTLEEAISTESPIAMIVASADDLDAQIATLKSAVALQQQPLPTLAFTFSDLATSIVAAIDTVTVLQKEEQGRVDNIIYQANQVETALDLAAGSSPLFWPIYQNCERVKSAAYQLKAQPAVAAPSGQVLKTVKIQKDSTLAQVASQVRTDIASFIVLNAQYVGSPVVSAGTTLQYFATAA